MKRSDFILEFQKINDDVYNKNLTQFSIDEFELLDSKYIFPLEEIADNEEKSLEELNLLYQLSYNVNILLEVLDKEKEDYKVFCELKHLIEQYD